MNYFLTEEARLNINYSFDLITILQNKLDDADNLEGDERKAFKEKFDAEFMDLMVYLFGDKADEVKERLDNRRVKEGKSSGDTS
ncbi:MAG: hypothetical protein QHH15_00325 [Candidatus Thermoplasmatota archaeon]|nr:hypothetical protein [Candidatus Thermoplasmatota archaeon]